MEKLSPDNSLTVKEVCKLEKISPKKVRRLITSGKLGAYISGREWRVKPKSLEDYRESQRLKVSVINPSEPLEICSLKEFDKYHLKEEPMLSSKTGEGRWFYGFGGVFSRLISEKGTVFEDEENGKRKPKKRFLRWYIWYYKPQGGRKTMAIPLAISRSDTLRALKIERKRAFDSEYPWDKKRSVGLKKLFEEFIEKFAMVRRKSWRNDKAVLKNLLKLFGDKDCAKITIPEIEEYVAKCKEAGDANGTINQRLSVFRRVLNWAKDRYDMPKNPITDKVMLPKEGRRIPKVVNSDEINRLFAITEAEYPWMIPVIKCGLLTGMRISAIQELKWENVDLENRTITIILDDSKNRRENIVPIDNDDFLKDLLKLKALNKADSGHVFVYNNPRFYRVTSIPVKLHFSEIVEKAGLKGKVTFHHFRHTVATTMLQNGTDIKTVSEFLGHASLKTTEIYLHTSLDRKRKAQKSLKPLGYQLGIRNSEEQKLLPTGGA